jgi:MYXO-CTERM domain-containing protein
LIVGFAAAPGYDLATGWGTIDFAKLAAAWPACDGGLGNADAGTEDSGPGPGSDAGGVVDSGSPGEPSSDGGSANNGAPGASSGCGCTTAGTGGPGRNSLGAIVALGAVVLRRRRRSPARV